MMPDGRVRPLEPQELRRSAVEQLLVGRIVRRVSLAHMRREAIMHNSLPSVPDRARRRDGHRTRLFAVVMLAMLLIVGGCPLFFDFVTRDGTDEAHDGVITLAELRAAAASIYDALEEEADVASAIEALLGDLVPIFDADDDEDLILEHLSEAVPVVLDIQIQALAAGYSAGILVEADSLFGSLAEAGITSFSRIDSVESTVVWNRVLQIAQSTNRYGQTEVVPALIVELARARLGDHGGEEPWGDGFLDPLQFELLSYSFHYASVDHEGPSENPSARSLTDREALRARLKKAARNRITGWVGDFIGLPLTPSQAFSSCISASVVLYSYQITLELDPSLIQRRREEQPEWPHQSAVGLTVSFSFVPGGRGREAFLRYGLGTDLPANGASPGKPVVWTLSKPSAWRGDGDLSQFGELSATESTTNAQGLATVVYTADDEPNQTGITRAVSGLVIGRVRQLMGSRINTLETVVVALNPDVGQDAKWLNVHYLDDDADPSPPQSWLPAVQPPPYDL